MAGQDSIPLPEYPSKALEDAKTDNKFEPMRAHPPTKSDTASTPDPWAQPVYTISHPKTLAERLEDEEHKRFGTRIFSAMYNTFVAGWHAGLLRAFILCSLVLVINIAVYSWLFSSYNTTQGTSTILQGPCGGVRRANTAVHLALNVASTLVLGASTYAMQGLMAPSRAEVDAAHAKSKFVEIGTSSVRNLLYVRRRNVWIWLVMVVTSLLLHLFFNAVFFATSQTNQVAVAVVKESYFSNLTFTPTEENSRPNPADEFFGHSGECSSSACTFDNRNITRVLNLLQDVRHNTGNRTAEFVRMEPSECIQNYTNGFMQFYGDVVVVAPSAEIDNEVLWTRYPHRSSANEQYTSHPDPYHWICHDKLNTGNGADERCSLEIAMQRFDSGKNWTVYGNPVNHCLARTSSATCQLQFNAYLMLAVVLCCVLKTIALCYLVFWYPKGTFLRTLGDAIASFLQDEDPTTKDMCLVSSAQIRKEGFQGPVAPQTFTKSHPRWFTSANAIEFWTTISVSAFYVICLAVILFFAIDGADGFAFSNGLGVPNIQSLLSFRSDDVGSSGIVPMLLIANIPQLGFALLFMIYSSLWSKLIVALEFDRFTQRKKGLRISERPRGMQRRSHFFTLPFRYAVPLMACSAALHWLCSQSFFMVRIDGVDADGNVDEEDMLVRLGYSATGVIAVVVVSFAMLVGTVCVGFFKRLSTGLGETSMSVIISAACHMRRYEPEPWLQEVMWGDVSGTGWDASAATEDQYVGHLGFSARLVESPIVGKKYQ